ncbi:mesenteric estrogen-dependent adipogenesis protein [Lampetra fluviatilis]
MMKRTSMQLPERKRFSLDKRWTRSQSEDLSGSVSSGVPIVLRLPREYRSFSVLSSSSAVLPTNSTCNCQVGILPLRNFLALMADDFKEGPDRVLTVNSEGPGGFMLISGGDFSMDGQHHTLVNYLPRKYVTRSLPEYTQYREAITSKPLAFFITVKAVRHGTPEDQDFAVLLNTRHPNIRHQLIKAMDNAIASISGESYVFEVSLEKIVKDFFSSKEGYAKDIPLPGLRFTLQYETDALFDIAYWLGYNKRELVIKVTPAYLTCSSEEKRTRVKQLLEKMKEELVRPGSSGSLDSDNGMPRQPQKQDSILEEDEGGEDVFVSSSPRASLVSSGNN